MHSCNRSDLKPGTDSRFDLGTGFSGQLPRQLCCWLVLLLSCATTACGETTEAAADSGRDWWAFQPLVKPDVPEAEGDHWSRNSIDRFVTRRLAEQQMQPAPQADKPTLVRRLYFDLVGLPPTPEEIDAFLSNDSPDAWEQLVDRLLEDSRYGEHWARFWLDVVRYAESDGWNKDAYRPNIWRYRDYVVNAFNADKPYPEFVREQLAGDEIPGDDPEHLVATGFLRLGIYEYNQRDARSHWNDIMNEITDVAGDVFLSLGMACARCHDHKFDPLPQTDYYKLRAFFEPIAWRDDIPRATRAQQDEYRQQLAEWQEKARDVLAQIDGLLKPYYDRKWDSTVEKFPLEIQACFHKPAADRTSWEQQMAYLVGRQFSEEGEDPLKNMKPADKERYEALKKELAAFDELKPAPLPELMTAVDAPGTIAPTFLPDDSEHTPVEPGFLSVLSDSDESNAHIEFPEVTGSSGRRTALAEWIGRDDNPLTPRVIVNRIWQQHFGQGIVPSSNDFGHLGQPPTHPKLLDWLATTFVEDGWSMKRLHKRILMSATWRQSAHHPQAEEYQPQDPAENLLWRSRIRRLKAEQLRDAMLSASGELDATIGGPSVETMVPRRALYVKSFRNTPDELLHAFDVANGLKSVAERNSTTTPTQALLMINGKYALARAHKLAERLTSSDSISAGDALRYAFRLTWGRGPTVAELASGLEFVAGTGEQNGPMLNQDQLIDFCHVLFNSSEFMYLD